MNDNCKLRDTCRICGKPIIEYIEGLRHEDGSELCTMNYEVFADKLTRGDWRVEAINYAGEGECFVTIFSGPDAQARAEEYAGWKNCNSMSDPVDFRKELELLVNKHSRENGCDTPDFILAEYLNDCLDSFDKAVVRRETWYSRACGNGQAITKEAV